MAGSDSDLWYFICDEPTGAWIWKRIAASGEERKRSLFSFHSFNVCVADAERAGFLNSKPALRRVCSPDLQAAETQLTPRRSDAIERDQRGYEMLP